MPIYEYHCRRCKEEYTVRMTVSEHDRHIPPCPGCGDSDEVEKRIGGAFVITERKS